MLTLMGHTMFSQSLSVTLSGKIKLINLSMTLSGQLKLLNTCKVQWKVDLTVVDFMRSWYCKSWSSGSWSRESWSRVRTPPIPYTTRYSALLTPVLSTKKTTMFNSNKISQHNLNNIPHRPSIAQALYSFCMQSRQTISAMLSLASYIAATHNTTHSPCTSKWTTHPALPTPLQKNTKHIGASGGKMAQDVGMVWKEPTKLCDTLLGEKGATIYKELGWITVSVDQYGSNGRA